MDFSIENMKYLHNCQITIFCKQTDDKEELQNLLERFKVDDTLFVKYENILIDSGEDITVLRLNTNKQRHNKTVIKALLAYLSDSQKNKLLQENDRVDDNGAFYVRLDKQALCDNKAIIVEHGDCVHFRFLLAAFPKNRENAIRIKNEMITYG